MIDIQESDLYALESPSTALSQSLKLLPATSFSLREIADLFTRSFEGAVSPIHMTADSLSQMIRSDSIDLSASRVLARDVRPAGFILVGTRGWSRRIAAMGVVATERKLGLGHRLMEAVIDDARSRGFRRIILEVIEKNTSAVDLYRHLGFKEKGVLVGYERQASETTESSSDTLKEIDPRDLAKVVEYEAHPDLPWQLSAETVSASGPPAVALRLEDKAYALITPVNDSQVTLSMILVPLAVRRQGWGLRLMRALFAMYPGCYWRFPTRFPENLAPTFFTRAGFVRTDLSQLRMVLELNGPETA